MNEEQRILTEHFTRSIPIEMVREIDTEKRTVEVAFSSEEPYEQWFGLEILDHSKGAVDMSRLKSGAALLVNHDSDQHVGVVENARIDKDRRGRAVVRFAKDEQSDRIFQHVQDGIRRLVSVGYRIQKVERKRAEADEDGEPKGPDTILVTKWQPLEISIVSVPADQTVGVGRSAEPQKRKNIKMSDEKKETPTAPAPQPEKKPDIDISVVREEATKAERQRRTEIMAAGQRMAKFDPAMTRHAEEAIESGMSVADFSRKIPELMEQAKATAQTREQAHRNIGMSQKELEAYSFLRAIRAASENKFAEEAGFEKEVSDQYAIQLRQRPGTFYVPPDVLNTPGFRTGHGKRDLVVGTATAGGNLVATNLLAGSFIDLLRNRMVIAQLGTRFLTGLVGDVVIPRQTAGVSASWMASEDASVAEGNATFDQVTLSPNTLHARQDLSKQLIAQATPSAEQLVRDDLATGIALALDLAAINGSGSSGQPTGILNQSGIGSVTAGADTNANALTWANVVSLETEVAIDNADMGSLAYLTNAAVLGLLKRTEVDSQTGIFIWGQNTTEVNSYPVATSNQVPSNLTAGTDTTVASAMIFGNFADLLVGQWGGMDVLVNPYTQASTRIVEVHTTMFADVDVRHVESFAASVNIDTT